MAIQIYSEELEERIVPAQIVRPSIRIIVPTVLTTIGDTIEVIVKVKGVVVGESIKYALDTLPAEGKNVVATVSLGLCEQKSANIPTMTKQVENDMVTKTPLERVALKEAMITKEAEIKK